MFYQIHKSLIFKIKNETGAKLKAIDSTGNIETVSLKVKDELMEIKSA